MEELRAIVAGFVVIGKVDNFLLFSKMVIPTFVRHYITSFCDQKTSEIENQWVDYTPTSWDTFYEKQRVLA